MYEDENYIAFVTKTKNRKIYHFVTDISSASKIDYFSTNICPYMSSISHKLVFSNFLKKPLTISKTFPIIMIIFYVKTYENIKKP